MDKNMITFVQIMTSEGMVTAVVDKDKKITAAHQNIRKIPTTLSEAYGQWVEVLDLSNNKLRDLSPLRQMSCLHTLVLDHNLVGSTAAIPALTSLRSLSLNFNLISDAALFVPRLGRACPSLTHLSLLGNAACASALLGETDDCQIQYRLYVLRHLGSLRHLDDKLVTPLERILCVQEEKTRLENVRQYFSEFKNSLLLKISRNNNIV